MVSGRYLRFPWNAKRRILWASTAAMAQGAAYRKEDEKPVPPCCGTISEPDAW